MTDDPLKRAHELLTEAYSVVEALVEENKAFREGRMLTFGPNKQDNRPKLSPRDVQAIHDLRRRGLSVSEIADVYDVHHATISRTLRGVYHKRGNYGSR